MTDKVHNLMKNLALDSPLRLRSRAVSKVPEERKNAKKSMKKRKIARHR